MAASNPRQTAAFETDVDEFEDVALLLEPDQHQQHSRNQPSWKSKFLELFARGERREHAGFEKIDQTDELLEESGQKRGTAYAIFLPIAATGIQLAMGVILV